MEIAIPIISLGLLGLVFGAGLAFASKKFFVQIDPRLDKIHGLLPGSNCGACGGAGCFGFAEQVLSGKLLIDACRVSTDDQKEKIAQVLNRKLEKRDKSVAVLHCNGGKKVKDKYIYQGIKDCKAANLLSGGQKECFWGCLGFGDCVRVCPFNAIKMSEGDIPVVDLSKCKACNKCVAVCPKQLFRLIPTDHPVHVACKSKDLGKDTVKLCSVGCIACRLCEKACKFDAIHINDNFAYINYERCTSCGECVKVCPRKTIKSFKTA